MVSGSGGYLFGMFLSFVRGDGSEEMWIAVIREQRRRSDMFIVVAMGGGHGHKNGASQE